MLPILFVPLAAGLLISAGKNPTYLISFHEEGAAEDGAKRVKPIEVLGENRYFKTSPTLTQNNVTQYWPFRSQDGQTWGAVFWLNDSGGRALQRIGAANRGQLLAAAVDRVPVDILYIDAQPTDSRIVIWKGLGPHLFKRIDEAKKIKRLGDGLPGGNPAPPAVVKKSARPFDLFRRKPSSAETEPADVPPATADVALPMKPSGAGSRERTLPELPAAPLPEAAPFAPDVEPERPEIVPVERKRKDQ
jgi:hypothetical protein